MADLKVTAEDLAFFVALAEEVAYDAGYRAGLDAANRAMDRAIEEATAGMDHDAVTVVRHLINAWERPVAG